MASLSQVECSLKHIMEERANVLARETGCIERQRKFSGADQLQTLVFGWLSHPDASLEALASVATLREVEVTDTAVHKRFTPLVCPLPACHFGGDDQCRRGGRSASTSRVGEPI